MSEVVTVTGHDFAGSAVQDGPILAVRIRGNADNHAQDAIDHLLTRVHTEAQRLGIAEIVVDLRQLQFVSSSCFRNFLTWLTQIQELPEAGRYKVKFVFNPGLHWQNRNLDNLRCFAIDLVSITEHQ